MLHPLVIVLVLYVLFSPAVFMYCHSKRLKLEAREREIHAPF